MGFGVRATAFQIASKAARAFGFDLVERTFRKNADLRLITLLRHHQINLVFDVGANIGQYGQLLREIGYRERIISFEPVSQAFKMLAEVAQNDDEWQIVNAALGQRNGIAQINVSANLQSSSLLSGNSRLLAAAPNAVVTKSEQVAIRTLDNVFPEYASESSRIFLKIDTQGFEREVLHGAKETLKRVAGIQLETPLVELYEGEALLGDMLEFMGSLGFFLFSVDYGFTDKKTGRLLEMDCVFFRNEPAAGSLAEELHD